MGYIIFLEFFSTAFFHYFLLNFNLNSVIILIYKIFFFLYIYVVWIIDVKILISRSLLLFQIIVVNYENLICSCRSIRNYPKVLNRSFEKQCCFNITQNLGVKDKINKRPVLRKVDLINDIKIIYKGIRKMFEMWQLVSIGRNSNWHEISLNPRIRIKDFSGVWSESNPNWTAKILSRSTVGWLNQGSSLNPWSMKIRKLKINGFILQLPHVKNYISYRPKYNYASQWNHCTLYTWYISIHAL